MFVGSDFNSVGANIASGNQGDGFAVLAGSGRNKIFLNTACNDGDLDGYLDGDAGRGNVWIHNNFCTSNI